MGRWWALAGLPLALAWCSTDPKRASTTADRTTTDADSGVPRRTAEQDSLLLARARAAARAYCGMHDYGDPAALDGSPVLGPIALTRDGRTLTVFRWLGSGRGQDFVQVELDVKTGDLTVSGAQGDRSFPTWIVRGPS
jgi:hypothetical protein